MKIHWHRWSTWGSVKRGVDMWGHAYAFQDQICSICNKVKRRVVGIV